MHGCHRDHPWDGLRGSLPRALRRDGAAGWFLSAGRYTADLGRTARRTRRARAVGNPARHGRRRGARRRRGLPYRPAGRAAAVPARGIVLVSAQPSGKGARLLRPPRRQNDRCRALLYRSAHLRARRGRYGRDAVPPFCAVQRDRRGGEGCLEHGGRLLVRQPGEGVRPLDLHRRGSAAAGAATRGALAELAVAARPRTLEGRACCPRRYVDARAFRRGVARARAANLSMRWGVLRTRPAARVAIEWRTSVGTVAATVATTGTAPQQERPCRDPQAVLVDLPIAVCRRFVFACHASAPFGGCVPFVSCASREAMHLLHVPPASRSSGGRGETSFNACSNGPSGRNSTIVAAPVLQSTRLRKRPTSKPSSARTTMRITALWAKAITNPSVWRARIVAIAGRTRAARACAFSPPGGAKLPGSRCQFAHASGSSRATSSSRRPSQVP